MIARDFFLEVSVGTLPTTIPSPPNWVLSAAIPLPSDHLSDPLNVLRGYHSLGQERLLRDDPEKKVLRTVHCTYLDSKICHLQEQTVHGLAVCLHANHRAARAPLYLYLNSAPCLQRIISRS
jgi:hypothetical protein